MRKSKITNLSSDLDDTKTELTQPFRDKTSSEMVRSKGNSISNTTNNCSLGFTTDKTSSWAPKHTRKSKITNLSSDLDETKN